MTPMTHYELLCEIERRLRTVRDNTFTICPREISSEIEWIIAAIRVHCGWQDIHAHEMMDRPRVPERDSAPGSVSPASDDISIDPDPDRRI